MVCTVGKIAELMNDMAPENWAEEWDNVGLLLGSYKSKVRCLMVVLDITPVVVREAIEKGADMIIAHHPLIFNPLTRIVEHSISGQLVIPLISHDIAVYCAHTNLDMARGGVDDSLAKALGLKDVQQLNPNDSGGLSTKPGFGRWGRLEPTISLKEFAKFVEKKLKTPRIELIGKDNKDLSAIALCAGSGSGFMRQAQRVGADLFVTGEIKYHDALMAEWLGIDIMVVGHFYSEMPAIKELIARLQIVMDSLQYKVEIIESEMQRSPYCGIIGD